VALDGSVRTVRVESFGPEGLRVLAEGAEATTVAPDALREVRLEPAPERPAPRVPHLQLALTTGDRLRGTFAGPTPDGLRLEVASAGVLAIPFEAVRSIEAVPAGGDPCLDEAARHAAAEDGDRVHVRGGDTYAGVIVEAVATGLRIETERGAERQVPWDALVVAHLQSEPPSGPEAAALHAEVETDDGSRLVTAAYPAGDAVAISFSLRAAPEVALRVPVAAVRRIRTRSERFAYASELPWTGRWTNYHGAPDPADSLGARWNAPRADRRPADHGRSCPLRVGGREFARGFGVKSKTRIEVTLDGGWKTFETGVGIDDEATVGRDDAGGDGPRGDVDARVLADGRLLWEAKGVKGREPPRHSGPLDVTGAKVLVLEVDWGADRFVLDHADWLDPILVR
jgi:hypothetical protein